MRHEKDPASPDDTGKMTGSHLREGLLREYSGVNNPPSLYDWC
jgi:hypothetical protein